MIHGDNLIYFFLKELVDAEDEGKRTGIWLPHNLYARLPVLLPHVIRDPSCRGNKSNGVPDAWNAPDAKGYVRDDNSRIKGIPKSLSVSAPAEGKMRDARTGPEFVASHIWRVTNEKGVLASRQPLLNSIVPNLVWLPKQISKLSDREGGIVQRTLQAMSWALFHDAPVVENLREVVKGAWNLLPARIS